MYFQRYYLGCLAHASYLIADEETKVAAVVDPQRDIDQYLEDAEKHGFQIKYVFLTHFHADFVAGHIELRDKASGIVTGVVNLMPAMDYDIDYLQGRILLTEPLASTVDDNLLVRLQVSGSASNGKGKARVRRIKSLKSSVPLNSKRDRAYPAGAPIRIDMTIVSAATRTEFLSAVRIPSKPAKNVRLRMSNSGMNDLGYAFTASGELSVLMSRK